VMSSCTDHTSTPSPTRGFQARQQRRWMAVDLLMVRAGWSGWNAQEPLADDILATTVLSHRTATNGMEAVARQQQRRLTRLDYCTTTRPTIQSLMQGNLTLKLLLNPALEGRIQSTTHIHTRTFFHQFNKKSVNVSHHEANGGICIYVSTCVCLHVHTCFAHT